MSQTTVLLCGPHRAALSGVSTHLNLLMDSTLADDFELLHFQVGSEGRREGVVTRLLRLVLSPFALFATILFRHVDIVHLNTSLNPRAYWRDLAYLLVAKLLRARVLYQVHGGALPQDFFAGHALLTRWLRASLRLPDMVVVLAGVELEAYREFVPDQLVVKLPNGIDCRPFGRVPTVLSRTDHPLRLVYIGRLAREKGLYEMLQALRLAVHIGTDARLIVAGDGPEAEGLRRCATALGIGSRVSFVGAVFGDAKIRLLAMSDVAVLPSYAEGLPYALLEAMAAGRPVLATPVGAIPDVATDGTHGYLVAPRDPAAIAEAIGKLAGDREGLSWMSRACRKRALAAYSIERLARELALHYRQLLQGIAVSAADSAQAPAERRTATPARRMRLDVSPPGQ
jgi:glycosyltransferase involved in cell wall biosynthesis